MPREPSVALSMSDIGELDYLSPDFDPSTLTIPKLRNILLEYNVNYPSSAKKSQLVQLFEEHVAPTANAVAKKRARTKPSARGIIDAPSSQVSVADEDEELELPEFKDEASRRTSRRSTRQSTEDPDVTLLAPTTARGQRMTNRLSRTPEPPTIEPSTARKSTRKGPIERIVERLKSASPEPDAWRVEAEDSPFSNDNPFQSASSPIIESKEESRRRTVGSATPQVRRKKSDASRRRTDVPVRRSSPAVEEGDVSMQLGREMMFARKPRQSMRVQRESTPAGDSDAGEEFAPEEEEEEEMALDRVLDERIAIPRRRRQPRSSGTLKTAVSLPLICALLGTSYIWLQEKVEVGYCGIGKPETNYIRGYEVPEWASAVLPRCEPCPQHAYCHPNMEVTCEHGFLLTPHPMTAYGLLPLPLPPTCEPDTEKARKVKSVADRAVERLRERNAQVECRTLVDSTGKHIKSAELPIQSLQQTVAAARKKSMSQEEFDNLWIDAIGEIEGRDEIVSAVNPSGAKTLRSTSLSRIPLSCAIRRSIRATLAKYIWPLVALIFLSLSGVYTRYKLTYKRTTEQKAKQLASYAMDRLATQASHHANDASRYPEAFLSMTHLRDDVLRDEFNAKRRIAIWEKVQSKVEGNSNVRSMVREGRSGDKSRVWEWVGAVQAIEESASARKSREDEERRRSRASSPVARVEIQEVRRWEENRPMY